MNVWLIVIAGWFFPGAGHFLQGKWGRGALLSGLIWGMFGIGLLSGGAYYPGYGLEDGMLLYLLNIFAKFGNLLGMFISFLYSQSPDALAPAGATFEYGGRFLEVAGLLNYLTAIDAADIYNKRKQ